ncbi:hypothetical protein ACHQM5_006215 [Ranunculus cassubicifolius]
MASYRYGSELLPERRDNNGSTPIGIRSYDLNLRRRRFGRVSKRRLLFWLFIVALIFVIYFSLFHFDLPIYDKLENRIVSTRDKSYGYFGFGGSGGSRSKRRKQHFPCKVGFTESVKGVVEPKDLANFTRFTLGYVDREEKPYGHKTFEPKFGGHQTLKERENSFYVRNQTLHCGFVKGPENSLSTGFDLYEKDKEYMNSCHIVVSSCIFGSSDFLRRPTRQKISEYSKMNVCFVMFLDEETVSKISSEGQIVDDRGNIGLWRIIIVRNLPYNDMRRTGKVPKFLSHRLFPSARYSIWLDSKMRLHTDPMLILDYFLWRNKSEYAISNHYDRHCVWEEVQQNKRLNKYNHTAIDEQFMFYQADGLPKFDPSDPNPPLPSYVPEGSFIVRAHTPMSNLFSCLWFNEVDRFTSRDQLSFAYTYLKLRRMNPDKPFQLNMFKDCERRALAKLFRHREIGLSPPGMR